LGQNVPSATSNKSGGLVVAGTVKTSKVIGTLKEKDKLKGLGSEAYLIINTTIEGKPAIAIAANEDKGVFYGVFHFLRMLQSHQSLKNISTESAPKIDIRILNHWDNLDRTVERG